MSLETLDVAEFDPFAQPALECVIPTSEAQREVWLADKLSTQASMAYNESINLVLTGRLDRRALRQALDGLVARHQSLRATVSPDGTELLIGLPLPVALEEIDLTTQASDQGAAALSAALAAAVETPFDLEQGPLFRAALYLTEAEQHVLLMTAHHIVCDGWSWGVITEDLGALYAEALGEAPGPDAPEQYSDYVSWETTESGSPEMAEHERFWLSRFQGSLPVLDLPTDRPRAPVRTFPSRRIDHLLDAGLVQEVRRIGAKAGASAFATLYASFAALIARLSGQDDVVIGVPAAGQSASGMHGLVGHCVNLLPVRTQVDAQRPFAQFVNTCGSELLDAFDHQTLTYGSLLKKLPIQRDTSRLPLVSIMFNVDQAVASRSEAYPGLEVELLANPRHFENFELFVNAAQVDGGLRLECQYNTDLFDAATIQRWLRAYEALLRAAVRQPDAALHSLDLLAPGEFEALAALQPAPTAYPADDLMHSAFERQAQQRGQAIALRAGATALSYVELDARSNRLARALRARGVQRGARVGLCLTRGADMLTALLAVLKSGATYVPLDPGFPSARLNYYAEDAQLALLLTETAVDNAPAAWCADAAQRVLVLDRDTAWMDESAEALSPDPASAQPEDAAYIIYTSGSTGKPKGVAVPHRAVVNFLGSMAREPGLGAHDVLAAVTTLSFDIAVLELLLPPSVGAQVLLVSRETAMDGNLLAAQLRDAGATCLQATPAMWRLLLDADWSGAAGFKALVGGEALPADLARAMLSRCGEVWNMYGPTETTVWSTVWKVDPAVMAAQGVSIGRPIANTSIWIVDELGQPTPLGVPGELCIGGEGVTLGYVDRPELTADRFIPDTLTPGARRALYRTGDRARWRNDGLLEHLGRLDFQVKVRGYRIELGEIEAACAETAGVSQAVVITREDNPGDVRIVGYLTLKPGATLDEAGLKAQLRQRLPDYMVPQHLLALDAVPLLPNGKIDRKALPAPQASESTAATVAYTAPQGDTERSVAAAMEEILRLPGLGRESDFFQLGGHSLLAARLVTRLNKALGIQLPLRAVFEHTTVAGLAQAVTTLQAGPQTTRAPLLRQADQHTGPLTVMQERIRFVEEMHPGRVVYNTPSAHRLTGPFDAAAFEAAVKMMVQRQPSLRTCIENGPSGPRQRVVDDIGLRLSVEDLSGIAADQREAALMARLDALVDTPFDIHQAPLLSTALFKLGDEEHVFLFMPHHLVWDGWSFDLVYQELAALYPAALAGQPSPLAPLAFSYIDYAHWHNQWLESAECREQTDWWKQLYARIDAPSPMLTDRPRLAGMSGVGASEWVHIDKTLTEQLRALALQAGGTLNMLVMAVYGALMSEALDNRTLVMGVPVRGRLGGEVESVMGFFNNMLPLPVQVRPELSVAGWIGQVKKDLLDAFAHQDVPFERLVNEPELATHVNRAGLYQTLFSFQDARERERHWGPLQHASVLVMQKGATQDFGLWLMEVPGGLEGAFSYNADLIDASTAALFRERLIGLLRRVVAAGAQANVAELLAQPGEDAAALSAWSLGRRTVASAAASAVAAARSGAASAAAASNRDGGEARLAAIWGGLLGMEASMIHAQDNFFDLGGNSLQVMQAVARMKAECQVEVDPRRYIHETLGQLAVGLDREGELARIWAGLLGTDAAYIQSGDNFFDLGGNSLQVMQAVAQMQQRLGVTCDPRRYVHETLGQLLVASGSVAGALPQPVATADAGQGAGKGASRGLLSRVFGRVVGRS